MATVALTDVVLYDKWPGAVNPNLGVPRNGFDSTSECGTANSYPLGTKVMGYEDGTRNPGWFTMCYMRFHDGTDLAAAAGDPSDGYAACFHACGTATADGSLSSAFVVTNDLTNSDGTTGHGIAFAAVDLSSDECGWFWIGGVCPASDVTRLAGDMKTNGDVKIGEHLTIVDDGTNCAALAPACLTAIYDLTNVGDGTISYGGPLGYSLQVDA